MKPKQYPNFQDLYSFEDCKKAFEAKNTFDCGLSPVCLSAPGHHYSVYASVLKGDESEGALLSVRTLKLEYAIQVWLKAALISAKNPGPLLYYWWLHYEENKTSFREIKYSKFYADTTPEKMVESFWKLLERIADSGEIKVSEGYSYTSKTGHLANQPNINFHLVLDRDDVTNAYKDIDDVFEYSYNTGKRTFKWGEIKDLFTQLTLKQLSLLDTKRLHRHSAIDKTLFIACDHLDVEGVKLAIRNGANVNALDEDGESALQHAVEFFKDAGKNVHKVYSKEELRRIESENYNKCVEIVDMLLAQGADIDLFGMDGMQPIVCAYYGRSIDMVKYLLEKGSNPNYNSYRLDDLFYCSEDSNRCTILDLIAGLPDDEYDDYAKAVETLIRNHGGRRFDWDYDPQRCLHIGKYCMSIDPTDEEWLFLDNSGWGIGNENSITIEDAENNQTFIRLPHIEGLKEWHQDYLSHININSGIYDWGGWNRRGYALAKAVAKALPETVALYYPYGDFVQLERSAFGEGYYLKRLKEKIWIDPDK